MKLTDKQQKKYELEKLLKLAKKLNVSDKNLEKKIKETKYGLDQN